MSAYVFSGLLLLYFAIHVTSRSLKNELKSFEVQEASAEGVDVEHQIKRRRQLRETPGIFDTQKCISSQDLISLGAKPSDEELAEFCAVHCEGVYSLGCTPDYVACSVGIPYVMSCPSNLVLDLNSEECVERSQSEVCNNASVVNSVAFGSESESAEANFLSQNFSCLGLGNSFQSVGCTAVCIACIYDEAVLYAKCPGSLKFDIESQSCKQNARVTGCSFELEDTATDIPEVPGGEMTTETSEVINETLAPEDKPSTDLQSGEPFGVSETASPIAFGASGKQKTITFSNSRTERPIGVSEIPQRTIQLTPTAVEQANRHKMIAFSCENKSDGLYGEECAVEIVACFSERAVLMRCPEGFLFDTVSKICMEKNAIPACGGKYAIAVNTVSSPVPTSFQNDQKFSSTTEASVAFGSGLNEAVSISESACKGLQDGIYSTGCSNKSFVCVAGIPIPLLLCLTSKFDLSSAACLPESQITSCSATSVTNIEEPILMQLSSAFMQPQPTETLFAGSANKLPETNAGRSTSQSKLFIFSCNGLPDGIYGEMCALEFYICIRGNAALLHCPDNFVYDAEKKYCTSLETMPQCSKEMQAFGAGTNGGQEVVTEELFETTEMVTDTTETFLETTEAVTVFDDQSENKTLIEFSCEFLPDGMYGRGCSTQFTACVAGSPIPMMCPAELKYDEQSVKCLHAANVPACGGQESEPVVPEVEETIPVGSRPPVVHSAAAELPSCEGKDDGLYGNGCSGEFYACVNGAPIPMRCPGLEKFDEFAKQCLGGAYVPACNGDSVPENSSVVAFGSKIVTPPSPLSSEFSCNGLPDGVYADGCTAEVTLCLSTRVVRYQCPQPLKYDTESMMCLPEENIAACQDQLSTVKSAVSLPTSQLPVPANATGFTCEGKPDGAYAEGCTSEFVMCTSGLGAYYRCPSPLKYDTEAEVCRDQGFISACGSGSTTNAVSGGAPVNFSAGIDCSERSDGLISSDCSSHFQLCVGGELKQYSCPQNLKFDNITKKCLPEPLVTACSKSQEPLTFGSAPGVEEVATVKPNAVALVVPVVYLVMEIEKSAQVTQTTIFEEVTSTVLAPEETTFVEVADFSSPLSGIAGSGVAPSCEDKRNGAYSDGCASEFYVCINGKIFYLYCRSPLKFDHQSNRCVEAASIPLCTTNADLGADAAAFGSSDSEFPCTDKPNGVYELGPCSSEFLICIDNQNTSIQCSEGYAYNSQSRSCILKENLSECVDQATSNISTEQIAFGSGQEQSVLSCDGKEDGLYTEGCRSEFFACIEGRAIQMRCPGLQKFDVVSKQCLSKKYVEACGATVEATQALGKGSSTFQITYIQEGGQHLNPAGSLQYKTMTAHSKPIMKLFPFVPFVMSCTGLPDGKYSRGCSAEFLLCVGGQTKLDRCPSSLLKFDSSLQQCFPASFVQECGAKQTESSEVEAPVLLPNQTVAFGATLMNGRSDFSCEGQPDGKYAQGCSPEFIQCENGRKKLLRCPGSLIFDEKTQQCRAACYVSVCTNEDGIESFAAPVGATAQATTTSGPRIIERPFLTMTTCFGKPDGTFADGCTPVFFMCIAGKETFYECPNKLKFDAVTEKCAPESIVPACGGPVPEGPSFGKENSLGRSKFKSYHGEGATWRSQGDRSIQEVQEKIRAQSRRSFECSKLPDGLYTEKCSPEFTLCVAGMPLLYRCPKQLIFDAKSEKCLSQGLVDSCAETATSIDEVTTGLSDKEFSTAEAVAFGASTAVSVPTVPVAYSITNIANFNSKLYFCLTKPDGIYIDGCSSDFIVCVAQTTLALHCTNSLKYDEVSGTCMDESEVAACTASSDSAAVAFGTPDITRESSSSGKSKKGTSGTLQGFGSGAANDDLSRYCAGRLDGLYAEGCSSQFISCVNGHGTVYDCPEDLKFNIASNICSPQEEIAACQDDPLIVEQPAAPPTGILASIGKAFSL